MAGSGQGTVVITKDQFGPSPKLWDVHTDAATGGRTAVEYDGREWQMVGAGYAGTLFHAEAIADEYMTPHWMGDDEDPPFPIPIPGVGETADPQAGIVALGVFSETPHGFAAHGSESCGQEAIAVAIVELVPVNADCSGPNEVIVKYLGENLCKSDYMSTEIPPWWCFGSAAEAARAQLRELVAAEFVSVGECVEPSAPTGLRDMGMMPLVDWRDDPPFDVTAGHGIGKAISSSAWQASDARSMREYYTGSS